MHAQFCDVNSFMELQPALGTLTGIRMFLWLALQLSGEFVVLFIEQRYFNLPIFAVWFKAWKTHAIVLLSVSIGFLCFYTKFLFRELANITEECAYTEEDFW